MKKKFYWKAFINNMGKLKFIGFIISIILAIIGMISITIKYDLIVVFETFIFSYIYDCIKDFNNAIKKTNEEYLIEEKQ